jgi:ABC-type transport system involved in multi-copper enzyme maturation permease subunit
MADSTGRSHAPELLHYRPWQGTFRSPAASVWPIMRTALGMMLRRKIFWVLYALGMINFLLFFIGQYLMAYADGAAGAGAAKAGQVKPSDLIARFLSFLDGSGNMYSTFIHYQGYIVTVVLAFAGSLLIGNDIRFGSLSFYLSKPVGRWHYLAGKASAIAVFINMMTTLPALALFIEYVLLFPDKFDERIHLPLLLGILAYGLVLTVTLSLILMATAIAVRKTAPLVMVWTTLFLFCRLLQPLLVDLLHLSPLLRLFDLWHCTVLVGRSCLGLSIDLDKQPSPEMAALVLVGVSALCLSYLILRIRAIEVVK